MRNKKHVYCEIGLAARRARPPPDKLGARFSVNFVKISSFELSRKITWFSYNDPEAYAKIQLDKSSINEWFSFYFII